MSRSQDSFERIATAAFDATAAAGRCVSFWWRDDDAVDDGPALRRLLEVAGRCRAPVAVAVIPRDATSGLAAALAGAAGAAAVQHGWAHANHAPRRRGQGAWELGPHRPAATVLAEAAAGRDRLRARFGQAFYPVMVPPWNRIDRALFPGLAAAGFVGVSAEGTEGETEPLPGFRRVDVHVDPLRWKGTKGPRFAGWERIGERLVSLLATGGDGPIGLNTHHRDMDDEAWACLGAIAERVSGHPGARWRDVRELFP